ncbi:antitoxin Xre/MbcA/ParS toxin-binding domain-containing protein [Noviherbaspirillum aridicola]|uniref:DUF2384 domain-containing protein n=1 Tax=Noviherbaspirillum aridicola TaxID=2849687 RepID=A0ABQ4Q0V8_9BURK|nr:antitoxin Xre/MbcA/ParS toxin-binding domain-containing protein [Noviherbaspirillum aridicola]GIZ50687.1 hypothetical protein NCCP691_07010 [Noviherbaspirillum aridicola]
MNTRPKTSDQAESVLSQALLRAADLLGISQATMARILGISPATASRLYNGSYLLSRSREKEWDFAVLFVRVFRSLDAIVGHGENARRWLQSHNKALNARPLDLLTRTEGIVRVLAYLDAYRGRI